MTLGYPKEETLKKKNFVNWNILVTKGKEINRDLVSSDERKLKSQRNTKEPLKKPKGGRKSPWIDGK